MNMKVKVLSNTYPEPVYEIQTSFTLDVGDKFEYKIPMLIDPEGNDEPECYVG